MILIEEYILLPQTERQEHLKLDEACTLRGGQSMYLKGLLAHLRDTSIPNGHLAHVAHACHNGACSNPNHIYWGTPKENSKDHMDNGGKTIWENMVAKYGEEGARAQQVRSVSDARKAGQGNKGIPKSEEHKQTIRKTIQAKYDTGELINNGGRKPTTPEIVALVEQHGIDGTAELLGITYEAAKCRYYRMKGKN